MTSLRRAIAPALVISLCPALSACNQLTGAQDLVLDDGKVNTISGNLLAGDMAPASGVRIREIAVYQGVKRALVENGEPAASDVPMVPGRGALVRVFVDTDDRYNKAPVTARLMLSQHEPIEEIAELDAAPTEERLTSTINFKVPAEAIVPGLKYRVGLLQPRGQQVDDNQVAIYPPGDSGDFGVPRADLSLHVVLVPIVYTADGSRRSPDTSPAQVQRYKDRLYATYPIASVDVKVHEPVQTGISVQADKTGWSALLRQIFDLRSADGAPSNAYYFGIFEPAATYDAYCGLGCVKGLGYTTDPGDVVGRVAIGLGYPDSSPADTAVHEIGHTHGRHHAPCGTPPPENLDPAYPHAGGSIGAWGYDILSNQLQDPKSSFDIMGYCQPMWVSDYTYKALFERIRAVSESAAQINIARPRRYARVDLDDAGRAALLPSVTLPAPPRGTPVPVTVVADGGERTASGELYAYDHLDGGVVFLEEPTEPYRALRIALDGKVIEVPR